MTNPAQPSCLHLRDPFAPYLRILVLAIALASGWTAESKAEVVFTEDFEAFHAASGLGPRWYSGSPALVAENGSQVLCLTNPTVTTQYVLTDLPLELVLGKRLLVTARVRSSETSKRLAGWNGVKLQVVVETEAGKAFPSAKLGAGTSTWMDVSFAAPVPAGATKVSLRLGLEEVSGTAWYDNIAVTILPDPYAGREYRPAAERHTGHAVPRLRGTMVGNRRIISEGASEALKTLGRDWNANVIRWTFGDCEKTVPIGAPGFDEFIKGQVADLDAILPICRENSLMVVLDMHGPSDKGRIFAGTGIQDRFVALWRELATHYKGNPVIWGYDLANEPQEDGWLPGLLTWQELAEKTALAIREIDPERTLIIEPTAWANPEGMETLRPIATDHVVYSFHMYKPVELTHQGMYSFKEGVSYPGVINGVRWDKEALERTMRPALEFQRKYNVHIFVGEFSCARWAPGDSACRYLQDCIELFEQYGWDWTYHCFRGNWDDGWSVEHDSVRAHAQRGGNQTDREQLLRTWFQKNIKPF